MKRRSFLKGLAVLPVLGLIHSKSEATGPQKPPAGESSPALKEISRMEIGRIEGFDFYEDIGDAGEPLPGYIGEDGASYFADAVPVGNRLMTPAEMAQEMQKAYNRAFEQIAEKVSGA